MMTNEALKLKIAELSPAVNFEESPEWLTVVIEHESWNDFALQLRSTEGLDFDYLFCLTCIDWKTHFTMVMHLTSTTERHTLVVKTKLDKNTPAVRTVSDIWKTAEFHEREVYDLFGVIFIDHPDLRRLFMTDDWKGWPLRKDYEDAVNMIKL
ncbi:MAG: NADH-quinone oxidoreductase subunit C [Chitinophagaceae bacterium]